MAAQATVEYVAASLSNIVQDQSNSVFFAVPAEIL
jgi:hypothetical protein